MLINLVIWLSPLRWNEFYIKNYKTFEIRFTVKFSTKSLTIPEYPSHKLKRLELIFKLHKQGLSTKDIIEYLQKNGYKPLNTEKYTPSLVSMTLLKYKSRLERFKVVVSDFYDVVYFN